MSEEQERPQEIFGLSEADFIGWKHHPVTKIYLQYLANKREYLKEVALNQWIEGDLSLQADQTVRGQIIELDQIAIVDFDMLFAFYEEPKQQEQNETETL